MVCELKVPQHPILGKCLAWSDDGELAVAANDTVYIYRPNLQNSKDFRSFDAFVSNLWEYLNFRSNLRKYERRPLGELFGNSIGELQTPHYNVSVAWTPLGYAKHGRSALAILDTSNILSIWASRTGQAGTEDWERVLVVNSVLRWPTKQLSQANGHRPDSPEPLFESFGGIRSFAWSHVRDSLIHGQESRQFAGALPLRSHRSILLAVSYNSGKIGLATFESSFESNNEASGLWNSEAADSFDLRDIVDSSSSQLLFGRKLFAENLCFGPWTDRASGSAYSLLAFIVNGEVYVATVTFGAKQPASHEPFGRIKVRTPILKIQTGRLRKHEWFDAVAFNPVAINQSSVLFFSNMKQTHFCLIPERSVFYEGEQVKVKELDAILGIKTHVIGYDRDESFSSVCFNNFETQDMLRLHTTTPLTQKFANFVFDAGADSYIQAAPDWATVIGRYRDAFSAAHSLGGKVKCRLWGIQTTLIQDLVVIGFSVHPSDRPEYLIPKTENASLIFQFSDVDASLSMLESFLDADYFDRKCNSELLLAALNALTSQFDKSQDALLDCLREFAKKLTSAIHAVISPAEAESLINGHQLQRYQSLFLTSSLSRKIRRAVEYSRYQPIKDEMEQSSHDYYWLKAVLQVILSLSRAKMTRRKIDQQILYNAAWIGAFGVPTSPRDPLLLEASDRAFTWLAENTSLDLKVEQERCRELQKGQDLDLVMQTGQHENIEICEVCDGRIDLVSLEEARCVNGHEFVRCCVSLLAIQSPGISKYCRICGKEYLNIAAIAKGEEMHGNALDGKLGGQALMLTDFGREPRTSQSGWNFVEDTRASTEELASSPSIGEALFRIFDKCVCCGSRFIG